MKDPHEPAASLGWRYAPGSFDPRRPLAPADRQALQEAWLLAPSSFGLQPYRIIEVADVALRRQLAAAAPGNAAAIDSAPLLLAVTAFRRLEPQLISDFIRRQAAQRATTLAQQAAGQQQMEAALGGRALAPHFFCWATQQAYLAAGFLLLVAAQRRVDVCPMEGFDRAHADALLRTADDAVGTVLLLAVGHRLVADPAAQLPKVRLPAARMWTVR